MAHVDTSVSQRTAAAVDFESSRRTPAEYARNFRKPFVALFLISGDVAAALGLPPQSGLATRAIDGARRFGLPRLERAYWRACAMDAGFKDGTIKGREEALAGLLLDLMTAPN